MKVTAIKTHKITERDTGLFAILDDYLPELKEKSIVVIVSKIIATTEGRIASLSNEIKDKVIKREADYYLLPEENRYGLYITIKDNYLTYSSGIDESNANGKYVFWPENPQRTANEVREYLAEKLDLRYLGVIITDMAAIPLQKGLMAGAIAYSGFLPFKNLTGTPDVFGRDFKYSWEGHLQGLAAAAGVVMGEGAEQTPIGIIEDIPFVDFQDRNPTEEELENLRMDIDADLFGPMIKAAKWRKGGK